jgi:hypothetical protein
MQPVSLTMVPVMVGDRASIVEASPEWRESRKTKQTNRFHQDPPRSCDRGHWSGETASGRDSGTVAVIDSPQVLHKSVTKKNAI